MTNSYDTVIGEDTCYFHLASVSAGVGTVYFMRVHPGEVCVHASVHNTRCAIIIHVTIISSE